MKHSHLKKTYILPLRGIVNEDIRTIANQDKGFVLITVMLLLLVLTVVGLAAIGTSTIENLLSGNVRLKEKNVSKADGAVEISIALIEHAVREQETQGFGNIINPVFLSSDSNYLPTELRSSAFNADTQDVAFVVNSDVPGTDVAVDIDKMYSKWMGGSAIEFASGYEGTGKSGGSGFYTFYRINSTGEGLAGSQATVGAIYRYVPK